MRQLQHDKIIRYLEVAAIAFGFIWGIVYPFVTPYPLVDLEILMRGGSGVDMSGFYYAPWSLPFFDLLSRLPIPVAGAIANTLSTLGFLYAIRVFKGNKILFFISYPLLYTLFYVQVDGIYAFALTIMYFALQRKNAPLAALGWLIALTKWYLAIPLGVGLLWYYADHQTRIRVSVILGAAFLASLVIWQNWVVLWAERLIVDTPVHPNAINSWQLFGPFVLLLWIPVFLSQKKDYRWWVATWALTSPYLHIHGLTHLLLFSTGIAGWLVQGNYFTGPLNAHYVLIVPLIIYFQSWRESWATDRLHLWWKTRQMEQAEAV
jgi:hypothetical protein